VLKMPPMGVEQSRGFYTKKIAEQFIPLAVVNGGGVPRDMERIVDIIQSAGEEWQNHTDYAAYCQQFEKNGLVEKIRNHPRISTIQKKELEALILKIQTETLNVQVVKGEFPKSRFSECYPCTADECQKDYYSLLGLFQAFAVKTEIFHLLHQWMQDYDKAHPDSWWARYQKKVDHLREAVYLVGNSPFAANEEVKKAKLE
jgi:hypothetical protein